MPDNMPPVLEDVNNAQQLARFLQWMADKQQQVDQHQQHLDRCIDELKELLKESLGADLSHDERMSQHLQFHKDAENKQAGRDSAWTDSRKLLGAGMAVGGTVAGLAVKYGGSVIAVFK